MAGTCPYCNKYYDSQIIKLCPLRHCPQCGEDVRDENRPLWCSKRYYNMWKNEAYKRTAYSFIIALLIVSLLTWELDKNYDLSTFEFIISTITFVIGICLITYLLSSYYVCPSCEKKFLLPTTNVPLVERPTKDITIEYERER